jgi:hypothetical protein
MEECADPHARQHTFEIARRDPLSDMAPDDAIAAKVLRPQGPAEI